MSLKLLTPEQIDALTNLPAPDLRAKLAGFRMDALSKLPPAPLDEPAKVENSSFKGPETDIPIRIYTPEGTGPFPVVIYFHGGGWVIGTLDSYDGLCREMCVSVGATIISVDYRLSPEAKFPAATEDCYAAVVHVQENAEKYNVDPARIAVAGDSAGGNLALVASIMSRERKGPSIKYQSLIYPSCDMTMNGPHKQSNPSAVLLPQIMNYFADCYLNGPEDMENPHCSPLKADLTGLPPAFVLTCEHDSLLEEGAELARRFKEVGVPCEYVHALGLDHGVIHTSRHHFPAVGPYQTAIYEGMKKALF
ncbi:hypothetical protein INT43_003058 [Umbelopsis isabellina]|uniref:Alpha/beta hydrolase fold-3 domain-containing protein n=1 Tax=Mortierella isabellina TaxID=91625 RepID=A0A8H7PRA3_MORIS|nr:hypothetical protein INT43_003058 [Umbelopsis isabellina]